MTCRSHAREGTRATAAPNELTSASILQQAEVLLVGEPCVDEVRMRELQFTRDQANLAFFHAGDRFVCCSHRKQAVQQRELLFIRGDLVKFIGHQEVLGSAEQGRLSLRNLYNE